MKRNAAPIGKRRGVALLLVMVGLVVCTLLTAGFLSTQGTSIAIAPTSATRSNAACLPRRASTCASRRSGPSTAPARRRISPAGAKMSPGTWLSNFAVGNGTVTVAAHSAGSTDSFTADYHQPIVLTSTGYANNRQFTLTATISPTGGGEVFRGGNYFAGSVVIGSGGLPLIAPIALVDSYDSSVGAYSTSGTHAAVWTNSTSGGSVTVNVDSVLNGSVLAGPSALLSSVVNLLGTLLGGNSSIAVASEPRDPGIVIPPNTSGLTGQGTFGASTGNMAAGIYDSLSVTAHVGNSVKFFTGVYVDKGNFNVASTGAVSIQGNTVIYVVGNVTLANAASISVNDGCSLTLYVGGSVTINGASVTAKGGNPLPAQIQILGLPSSNSIQITNASTVAGVVYAPQASVLMKNSTATGPVMQGAIVAHDVTLQNIAQFHYDEATKKIKISNISGGTAPPGAADYSIAVK